MGAFRDLFANRCQFLHFHNYVIGLFEGDRELLYPPESALWTTAMLSGFGIRE